MFSQDWKSRNSFGDADLLSAVGGVIVTWNYAEQALHNLLWRVMNRDYDSITNIEQMLSVDHRLRLLIFEGRKILPDDELNCLELFSSCLRICQDNRNKIVHANYGRSGLLDGVALSKPSKKDPKNIQTAHISKVDMDEIAQANFDVALYGWQLAFAIWAGPSRMLMAGDKPYPAPLPADIQPPRRFELKAQ